MRMTPTMQRWFRQFIPLIGLLVYALVRFAEPEALGAEETYYRVYGWRAYLSDILTCILGSWVVFESSLPLNRFLERVLPWERFPVRRIIVQSAGSLAVSSLAIWLITAIMAWLILPIHEQTIYEQQGIRLSLVVGGLIILFVNAVYIGAYFLKRLKGALTDAEKLKTDAEKLKRESIEARYEALRSQLDPHFLFNTLNTLIYLIEDKPVAVSFVENLSLVYRYVLQSRDRTLVPLDGELMLARAYVSLLEQRHGAGMQVSISVPDWAMERQVPPMTLQLLLENAVKHNQVDPKDPLMIRLTVNEREQLVVENSVHPRLTVEGHTRVGLENIRSRYRLLADVEPDIQQTARTFCVKLPLLTNERIHY